MQPGNQGPDPHGAQPPPGGQPPQYGQQPGGYPNWPGESPGAPAEPPSNTQGLVAMILGIAAIPLLCCFLVGIPLGIAATVLGYLGRQKADQGLATNRGQAQAGFICGIIAVVLGVILLMLRLASPIDTPNP